LGIKDEVIVRDRIRIRTGRRQSPGNTELGSGTGQAGDFYYFCGKKCPGGGVNFLHSKRL